jgi:hypothetical protein
MPIKTSEPNVSSTHPKIDRRIAIAKQESQQDLVKVPVLRLAEAEEPRISL